MTCKAVSSNVCFQEIAGQIFTTEMGGAKRTFAMPCREGRNGSFFAHWCLRAEGFSRMNRHKPERSLLRNCRPLQANEAASVRHWKPIKRHIAYLDVTSGTCDCQIVSGFPFSKLKIFRKDANIRFWVALCAIARRATSIATGCNRADSTVGGNIEH